MYLVKRTFSVDHPAGKGEPPRSVEHKAGDRVPASAIPEESLSWLLEQGVLGVVEELAAAVDLTLAPAVHLTTTPAPPGGGRRHRETKE